MRQLLQRVFEKRSPRTDQSSQDLRLAVARNVRSAKSLDATIEELLEANRQRPQTRPN